jgi:acyl carrier protein
MKNLQKFISAFSDSLGINPDLVTDELEYNTIPEWDSLAHMKMIAALENSFGIMLDTDDIIDMNSIKAAKQILAKYGVSV